MDSITIIIAKRQVGREVTQEERTAVKDYVRDHIISLQGDDIAIDSMIQLYFPEEYGQGIDEQEDGHEEY